MICKTITTIKKNLTRKAEPANGKGCSAEDALLFLQQAAPSCTIPLRVIKGAKEGNTKL